MNSTTLCLDFGNTRQKCAIFQEGILQDVVVLEDISIKAIKSLITSYYPSSVILSSVINHDKEIENYLIEYTKFHKLSHKSALPFKIPVSKPDTVGADRLAICAAAVDYFPDNHTLSIGLGTCITYNFTNKHHEFLGGSISPGLQMRFKAMHQQTALLPMVEAEHNFPLVGYDTNTNLQSGVILGISKEIDGIIEAYNEKYNNLKVLMTGGDMGFFMPHLKNKIVADPNLLFRGLYVINKLLPSQ